MDMTFELGVRRFFAMSSEKEETLDTGFSMGFDTKVPDPRLRSRMPFSKSWENALRTVTREIPSFWASSLSLGISSPGPTNSLSTHRAMVL